MVRTAILLFATVALLPVIVLTCGIDLSGIYLASAIDLIRIMVAVSALCFIISELTGNYSQVDKIWSIIPLVYIWIIAFRGELGGRLLIMAVMATLWGIRLTYNFGRRGGYNILPWRGEEDYRWAVLRKMPFLDNRYRWMLFNLLFISLYQNALILLFTMPSIVAWQGSATPLGWLDILATFLMAGLILIEYIADNQQYRFQQEKKRLVSEGRVLPPQYSRGFVANGLWRLSRHPNYAAEQAIWFSFYLYGVAATGKWINWSLAGVILLVLLFFGSSSFSEAISAGKYPGYRDYIKRVPRFIPSVLSGKRFPRESF